MPKDLEKPLPEVRKNTGFFVVATVCASPFVLVSGYAIAGIFAHRPNFLSPLIFSFFFWPLLFAATIAGFIFIVAAWIKSPHWCKPFLILYSAAISVYWIVLLNMGPL